MKKILLTTTVLALTASAAFADMKAEVGGHVNAYASSTSQSKAYKTLSVDGTDTEGRDSKYTNNFHFVSEGEVDVTFSDTADTGLGYGAEMVINTDNSDSTGKGEKLKFRSAKLFVSTDMGKVELGGAKSAADQLKVQAPTLSTTGAIATHSGAVGGDYVEFVRMPGYYDGTTAEAQYITSPKLPSGEKSRTRYANKLVFLTPKMSGFQAAISYMPHSDEKGTYNSLKSRYNTDKNYRNVVNAALTFEHEFDGVKLDASIAGERGDVTHAYNNPLYRDLRAWEAGLKLTMDQFSIGAVHGSHGKSGKLKVADADSRDRKKTSYWAVGATYESNGLGLGVNTFQGKRDGNKTNAYGFTADYMLAKGLVTYADLTFFKLKPYRTGVTLKSDDTALAGRNKGHVLLVGAKVNF